MGDSIQLPQSNTQRSQKMVSPLLWLGLLGGVVFHLVGFLVFRVVSSPLPDREATHPFVEYVSAGSLASDRELEEQAALFDSAPLFIPTRWNASQAMGFDFGDATLGQFPEFEPAVEPLLELQPSSLVVADDFEVNEPIDLLASRFWRFFTSFAESAQPVVVFPDAGPVAEVWGVGQSLAQPFSIPVELDFTTSAPVSRPVWYYLRISGSGLVLSEPTLGQSSGNEDFDRAAAEWLKRPEVFAQLPRGYLLIKVFPW